MALKGITFNKDAKGNPISVTIDLTIHQAIFDKFFSEVLSQSEPTEVLNPIKPIKVSDAIMSAISTARTFLGTKHVTGGTSKTGIDCSGLSSTAYSAVGIKIPRSSVEQAKFGKPIKKEELQAGDLVFFATDDSRPNVVTHVGLVTKGGGQALMIHASTSRGVVEEQLFSDYYSKRFLHAMRVV
jgi:cell wall-associated NlpC family hydrolase